MTANVKFIATALTLSFASSVAFAQSLPQGAAPGLIDKALELELPTAAEDFAPTDGIQAPAKEKITGEFATGVTLEEVRLSGVTKLTSEDLKPIIDQYIDKPLTEQDLVNLKYSIAFKYFEKGFILVKIFSPPQIVSDGVLDLIVVEGRINKVISKKQDGIEVRDSVIDKYIDNIKTHMVFHQETVETAISDIDELADLRARLVLSPGEEFGTTNLNVHLAPAEEERQSWRIHNHGSSLTGNWVGDLNLEKTNALGLGETLSFSGAMAHGRSSQQYNFKGQLPLGYKGLTLDASYALSNQNVGWLFRNIRSRGESETMEVALSKNLLSTGQEKVTLRGGFGKRKHSSYIAETIDNKDDVSEAFAEISYLKKSTSSIFFGAAKFTRGLNIWGANPTGDRDASRATAERAMTFEPTIYYSQRLSSLSQFSLAVRGQIASNTLISSNLFSIGGYGSVRGFEPAYTSGESGISINAEYKYQAYAKDGVIVDIIPFFDWGMVSSRATGATPDRHLKSVGIAADVTKYLPEAGDKLNFRFDLATPLGDYSNPALQGARLYFSMRHDF